MPNMNDTPKCDFNLDYGIEGAGLPSMPCGKERPCPDHEILKNHFSNGVVKIFIDGSINPFTQKIEIEWINNHEINEILSDFDYEIRYVFVIKQGSDEIVMTEKQFNEFVSFLESIRWSLTNKGLKELKEKNV